MDPNETLRTIRKIVMLYHVDKAVYAVYDLDDLVDNRLDDLVDRIEALDNWMSSGGFAPEAWGGDPRELIAEAQKENPRR